MEILVGVTAASLSASRYLSSTVHSCDRGLCPQIPVFFICQGPKHEWPSLFWKWNFSVCLNSVWFSSLAWTCSNTVSKQHSIDRYHLAVGLLSRVHPSSISTINFSFPLKRLFWVLFFKRHRDKRMVFVLKSDWRKGWIKREWIWYNWKSVVTSRRRREIIRN